MKKQLFIIFAGLALSAQPAFAYYPWEMWQGSRALEAKDYAAAALRFQTALQEQPDSPQAHYNLGECLYRENKYQEAAAHFKKAMDGSTTQLKGKAAYNLGNTLFREKKLEEALDAYKTALRWDEIDDDARYNIQVILDMLKKNQDPKKDQDKNKDDKDKNKDNKDKDKDKDKDKGGQGNKGDDKDKSKNNDDKSQAKNDENKDKGKDQNDKSKGKGDGKQDDKSNQDPNKPKDDQQGKDQNQNGGQQPQGGQNPQQSPNNGQQPQNNGNDPGTMSRQEAERMLNYFANQEKRKMQQGKGKKAGIVGLPTGETW